MGDGGVLSIVVSAAASAATVLFTYLGAKRLGLTASQRASQTEVDKLVNALKDRMAILEAENRDLKLHIAELTVANGKQEVRIAVLEDVIRKALNRESERVGEV